MAFASNTYTAAAGQTTFEIPFDFISTDHIVVKINEVETSAWSVVGGDVVLNNGAIAGQLIEITRITPIDVAVVTFNGGSTLTSQDLNSATLQALYSLQELDDTIGETLDYVESIDGENGNLPSAGSEDLIPITTAANEWGTISLSALGTVLGVDASFVPSPTGIAADRFIVTTGSNTYALETASQARTSLGLGDLATTNLASLDLTSGAATFRTQLGLGTAAVVNTGTTSGSTVPLNTQSAALGTAAYKDTGTDSGDVVLLITDGGVTKLPALDGSLLTNVGTGSGGSGVVGTDSSRCLMWFEEASNSVAGGAWSTAKDWGWFGTKAGSPVAFFNQSSNNIGSVTITSDNKEDGTVTLPAGTYYAEADISMSFTKSATARIVKSDESAVYVIGFGDNSDKGSQISLRGTFTIGGSTEIALQVWTEASTTNDTALGPSFSNGFASPSGSKIKRRELRIWKIA